MSREGVCLKAQRSDREPDGERGGDARPDQGEVGNLLGGTRGTTRVKAASAMLAAAMISPRVERAPTEYTATSGAR